MKIEELNYYLPPELIAQQPLCVRSDSKLLVFNRSSGELVDSRFASIGDFLLPGDCLVLNDTKVLPARFFARRGSTGTLEGLFLLESTPGIWEIMLKGTRKIKTGVLSRVQSAGMNLGQRNTARCDFGMCVSPAVPNG